MERNIYRGENNKIDKRGIIEELIETDKVIK